MPTKYRGQACAYTRGTLLASMGSNSFSYDADGLRLSKNNTNYTYIGGKLMQENGTNGAIFFGWGSDGIMGIEHNGTSYFFRKNAFGDVTHIYDVSGTLHAKYIYDAWGNHQVETFTDSNIGNINPIRYRGYYYDTETGLYYLKARYYDPETGRFISQDNVGYLDPDHVMGLNLYLYCNNNPVMYTDPTGCSWWSDFWNSTAGKIVGTVLIIGAVAALTILTAGVGGAVAIALGNGVGAAILGGAVGGAVSGAIFGAGLSIISQGISNGYSSINWAQVGIDTVVGAASGAIWGAALAAVGRGLGLLGKTKWAQRSLKNWTYNSKHYMYGSKSGNFTFFRNGHLFRLEASVQHGIHYHYVTSKEKWKLLFAIGNEIAGFISALISQLNGR